MKNKIFSTLCMCSALIYLFCGSVIAADKSYKAAEIYTQDSMLYGKYVIRMKAAKGSGIISNFFLWKEGSELSSIFWEEVDFEVFGKNNAESWQSNIITGLDSRQTSEGVHTADFSFADEYHTFTLEWTPNYLAWFIDGVEIRRTTGDQVDDLITESTIRFNFWAPNIPAWVGTFDDAILPVAMFINWAEYHHWNGEGFDLEWRDDFDQFDSSRWVKAEHTFAENLTDFVPENAIVRDGYLVLAMTHVGEEGFFGTVPVDGSTEEDDEQEGEGEGEEGEGEEGEGEEGEGEANVACTYTVINQWNTGFTAEITLTNNSTDTVEGWSVNWQYDDGTSLANTWNSQVSGSDPYTAEPIGWNSTLYSGQSVSFGMQGVKGSATEALVPEVSGDVCQ